MTDFGSKIAELRAANKMTQAQLGSMLNVTSQAVSKWENGLSEPDIESIKKMCEIFHISFDEFFGVTPQQTAEESTETEETATEAKPLENTSVVLAYCDTCDKPLYNPKEYQVSIENGIQHTTCLECVPKKIEAANKAKEDARKRQRAAEKENNWQQVRKGLLWGIVPGVALALAAIIAGFSSGIAKDEVVYFIVGTVFLSYGGYTMLAQFIWDNSVRDFFGFFLRTLRLPGVIFTLDINGLLFLIFVKVAGAILSAIVSVLLFIAGFILTLCYSIIIFPFALIKQIREL